MIERAEIIREKGTDRQKFFRGQVDKYTWVDVGSSYLPSEIVGAFLYAQLEEAEKIVAVRSNLFERYWRGLEDLQESGLVQLPTVDPMCGCNGHLFFIITHSLRERTRLIEFLRGHGIHAVFHYVPLHSSPAGRKYGRAAGSMCVTDDLSQRIVRLPLYYEMTDEDVDRVVDRVHRFYDSA